MKGCVSFSLYGQDARYSYGLWENVHLAALHYPGWDVVVHAERGHYAIPRLRSAGAEVVEMDPVPGSRGMFWRFLPVDWVDRYTHVIVRDADSRINPRDVACTEAWLRSGKTLHVIRDHPAHERVLVVGGAWGIKTGAFPMKDSVAAWNHSHLYGDDEAFLGEMFWKFYPDDFIRHSHSIGSPDDTPVPEHAPWEGHVCEQVVPAFSLPFRAFVLSPERYAQRRVRFFSGLESNGAFLKGKVEWRKAKTLKDRVVPSHVDHASTHPHYHLASRDHLDLLEEGILRDDPLLFVFEDDAVFEPDFNEFFLRMWMALPEDWQACMLGGQSWTDHAREHVVPPQPHALASIHGCLGMHAVLWRGSALRRAFDHFTFWNRMTIDQAFRGLQGDEPGFYAPAKWIVGIDPDAVQFGGDS